MSQEEILLKPCPFCGPGNSIVSLWFDDVSHRFRVSCGRCGCSSGTSPRDKTPTPAIAAWNARGLPTRAALSMAMSLKAWDAYGGFDTREQTAIKANAMAEAIRSALADLPSSPAPVCSSLNSGESESSVMPASGAGEAIFAECAEIALEHVGSGPLGYKVDDLRTGYDQACRDIAEAIKLRAANRKTMDALAGKVTFVKP